MLCVLLILIPNKILETEKKLNAVCLYVISRLNLLNSSVYKYIKMLFLLLHLNMLLQHKMKNVSEKKYDLRVKI